MLCLTLGSWKPFLSWDCCPCAGLHHLQWCCSVDQAPAGLSLCGLEVTMSLCADRKGRCDCDIPSSFPGGPVEEEELSAVIRPVIWRAGAAPGWPRILSLLPPCSTPEAFAAAVSEIPAFRVCLGDDAAFALCWFFSLIICKQSVLSVALLKPCFCFSPCPCCRHLCDAGDGL